MKNFFSRSATVLTLGLALVLTSCDKQLDIDPLQSVDAGTALNSEANVTSAVVGLYAQLGNSNLYGTNLILVPELLATVDTYIRFQGTFGNFRDIANRNTRAENSTAETIWREAYQAINQTNLVIDALPVVQNAASKTRFEGEARFVRGTMYFELVRLYGKQYNAATAATDLGVPISLVPVRTVEEANRKIARSTVAQVYAQAIDDLTKAIALLPTTNGNRATRFTAKAMLARVYLQQNRFAEAGVQADEVIKTSGKSLAPTLEAVFRGRNGSETLLEIQQNDQNNAGTANSGLATHYASLGGVGRGDVLVLPAFAAQYGPNDARGKDPLLYNSTGARRVSAPNVALRTGKYTTFGQNIPVIRLAEMYLIRAEAAFRAGDLTTALADLNRIRTRSGATPLTLADLTPANGLATILRERQLELAFEGFRIHDLKRTGTNLVTSNGTVILITDNRLVLPIPKRETDLNDPANPVLIQNPGY
ncbi:RagB/SusD family nutrient uptake outer membrane protein [Hymenobacter glacialis]|uniref:Carbohydrate-binding protein SusD n=1 Tax=Hymenobacter glacialis TaxID=1908236 RepID=A0A1G1SUQ5_9BACT|nr:RagB/SusD family nutrient uptake outer membrane protein [Hymenobacter glacialis]OGX82348.1 hypothetical protein BEN48_05225 [Hymenobacter glacialis]